MRKTIAAIAAVASLAAACEKKEKNSGADTTAPEVESTDPVNGGKVSVTAAISATFSEALDPATITEATFQLSSGSTIVAGVVSYADDTATFTPTAALAGDASYTAQILDDVTDEAGNAMESAYNWSFTTSAGEFVLSSSGVTPGVQIPIDYTCEGANVSPPLAWTAGPAGTMSYAIIFRDLTFPLIHWVIWDIPSSETLLPESIPNVANPSPPGGGAMQTLSYDGSTRGYLGPCPPAVHTYEWTIYAIDVASLPGLNMATTSAQAETAILAHDLASASLSAPYTPL